MLNERAALSSCNGHHFKKKVMNKPMDCSRCREALWLPSDGAKTAVECEGELTVGESRDGGVVAFICSLFKPFPTKVCHALCHNYCKMNFDVSCQHYVVLKDVTPLVREEEIRRRRMRSLYIYFFRLPPVLYGSRYHRSQSLDCWNSILCEGQWAQIYSLLSWISQHPYHAHPANHSDSRNGDTSDCYFAESCADGAEVCDSSRAVADSCGDAALGSDTGWYSNSYSWFIARGW